MSICGYLWLKTYFSETGFHQKTMLKEISQQTNEAMTSGGSCLNSCASAASTVAESVQSWARLIIIKSITFACQMAVLPRRARYVLGVRFIMASSCFNADRVNFAVFHFERDAVERTRRRTV